MSELSLHVAKPEQIKLLRTLYEDSLYRRLMNGTMNATDMFLYNPYRDIKKLKKLLDEEKKKPQSDITLWLVKTGRRNIGYMAFQENAEDIRILQLHTLPSDQKPGAFLETKLEEYARAKNIKTLSVISGIWAKGFYEKQGYTAKAPDTSVYEKILTPG